MRHGPGSAPLAPSSSLGHAQTAAYTAGTCVSPVSLLLNVYLLRFPRGQCPPRWLAAAGGGGWHHWHTGHSAGPEGSGVPAPHPALSTRNVSSPVCPLRPPPPAGLPALRVPFSLAPALQQRPATVLGTNGQSPQASSLLLPPGSSHSSFTGHLFSAPMRHQLLWLSHLNPSPLPFSYLLLLPSPPLSCQNIPGFNLDRLTPIRRNSIFSLQKPLIHHSHRIK